MKDQKEKDRAQEMAEEYFDCDRGCDFKDGSHWHDCRVSYQDLCDSAIRQRESELRKETELAVSSAVAAVVENVLAIHHNSHALVPESFCELYGLDVGKVDNLFEAALETLPNHAAILTVDFTCPRCKLDKSNPTKILAQLKERVRQSALQEAENTVALLLYDAHPNYSLLKEAAQAIRALMEKKS